MLQCCLSEMRVASTGGKLGVQATSSIAAAASSSCSPSNAASGDASVGVICCLFCSLSHSLTLSFSFSFSFSFKCFHFRCFPSLSLLHSPPLSPSLFLSLPSSLWWHVNKASWCRMSLVPIEPSLSLLDAGAGSTNCVPRFLIPHSPLLSCIPQHLVAN